MSDAQKRAPCLYDFDRPERLVCMVCQDHWIVLVDPDRAESVLQGLAILGMLTGQAKALMLPPSTETRQ